MNTMVRFLLGVGKRNKICPIPICLIEVQIAITSILLHAKLHVYMGLCTHFLKHLCIILCLPGIQMICVSDKCINMLWSILNFP